MKRPEIGDLVKYKNLHGHVSGGKFISKSWVGLVIDIEKKKEKNLIVMWSSGIKGFESESAIEVISESR